MKGMKSTLLLTLFLVGFGFTQVKAQDITDEDLKNYAIMEMAVESITSQISPEVNELIEKQEGMTGQRFQELQKGTGEPAKDWEKQFMDVVNKQIEKKKQAAEDVFKLLAMNSVGSTKYKEIKTKLTSDASLKARYDAITAKCK